MKLRPGTIYRHVFTMPSFFGAGAINQDIGTDNINAPASTLADDILILVIKTGVADGVNASTGYTAFPSSPVIAADCQLQVLWKRATAGGAANDIASFPNVDVGSWVGAMVVVRGVSVAVSPATWTAAATIQAAGTAISIPSLVAPAAPALIMYLLAANAPTSASGDYASPANAALTSVTERLDGGAPGATIAGNVACFTGVLAAPGSTGTFTATKTTSAATARLQLAITNHP